MKYLQFTIALVFFWTHSFSQQITIDQFENFPIESFDRVDGITKVISAKSVKDGFNIQVINQSGIELIKVKNSFNNFLPVTNVKDTTNAKLYTIINPKLEDDGNTLLIKLIKNGQERTLTLKIQPSQDGGNSASSSSNPTNSQTDCNPVKNYYNNFGEESKYYNKQKIVYVYDFNKDPSKREFYKITLDHDTLKRELVNFNKETLTSGKNVKFKIYNINKFMYDVSIADSVIHFDSEPSALFTRFFLGDSTLLGNLMGQISDPTKLQSNDKTEKLLNEIVAFINKYNGLRSTALDALNPCHQFTCCNNLNYSEFLNTLAKIKAETENVKRKLNAAKNDVSKSDCNKQIKLKTQAESSIKNLNFAISKLDIRIQELILINTSLANNVERIRGEVKEIESQVFFSKGADSLTKRAQLLRLETELTSRNSELASSRLELTKFQKDRDSIDLKAFEILTSIDSIKYTISQLCKDGNNTDIQDMIDALEASDYLIKNLPSEDDLKKLIVFINNMVVQNNSFTSDYISLNGNMLDLTINIDSKDSIFKYFSIPEYKNDPLQIQIPILGKTFVSFSSGSFIALGKHLQNKTYSWQGTVGNNNTVSDSNYTLVESGYTLPPMGFCALGNLEWKVSRSFGLGGSAGVGLSIEKSPRMAYLGGVSLFFGDLRQFTITGGFVGLQVNKLTNNFKTVSDNQVIYTSKPNIEYYKEFKVGGFISLTYTPFKVYKTKTVKSKNK
ncbi:MAG: hypothetical protein IPI50_00740 [Saprospiraceae bacterium]|nr:hypothetical protein [Saprospiraceae bacterium]